MRRYTLNVSDREFVIDVQAIAADRFEVLVGGESYAVTLSSDENLAEATITPGLASGADAAPRSTVASSVARIAREASATTPPTPTPRKPTGGASGKASLSAPMPGVILEVSVKAGDKVERGQQVAILDAMKMHNVIGAPRAGTVGEVFVIAGQTVDHGDTIITFAGA